MRIQTFSLLLDRMKDINVTTNANFSLNMLNPCKYLDIEISELCRGCLHRSDSG